MNEAERELARMGIRTVETDERVDGPPALVTRFRWRADRSCRLLNRVIPFPSYRWEVVREDDRWKVVAMQNVGVSSNGA